MYIDIHSHKAPQGNTSTTIQNLWEGWEQMGDDKFYSIGLHPWHLAEWETALPLLETASAKDNVIAIGECGLDRICETDFAVQMQVFEAQIEIAVRLGKPLIIHCVRAWDEVFRMLRGVKVPVVFHGFNKGAAVLEQMCATGYYVSFGSALLVPDSNARKHLPFVPASRFFLETDTSEMSIETLYQEAAILRHCTVDDVILQLETNFHTVFKK